MHAMCVAFGQMRASGSSFLLDLFGFGTNALAVFTFMHGLGLSSRTRAAIALVWLGALAYRFRKRPLQAFIPILIPASYYVIYVPTICMISMGAIQASKRFGLDDTTVLTLLLIGLCLVGGTLNEFMKARSAYRRMRQPNQESKSIGSKKVQ